MFYARMRKISLVLAVGYLFNNETILSDSIKNLFATWQTYQQCILGFVEWNNMSREQQTIKMFWTLRCQSCKLTIVKHRNKNLFKECLKKQKNLVSSLKLLPKVKQYTFWIFKIITVLSRNVRWNNLKNL